MSVSAVAVVGFIFVLILGNHHHSATDERVRNGIHKQPAPYIPLKKGPRYVFNMFSNCLFSSTSIDETSSGWRQSLWLLATSCTTVIALCSYIPSKKVRFNRVHVESAVVVARIAVKSFRQCSRNGIIDGRFVVGGTR